MWTSEKVDKVKLALLGYFEVRPLRKYSYQKFCEVHSHKFLYLAGPKVAARSPH
jgi:hypothetical protein